MDDSRLTDSIRDFFTGERGVSPVIAVALLILIAIGFAVAVQGVGSDIITSVQEPPEASINGDPQQDRIRLTVESARNADELRVLHNGTEITASGVALSPSAGSTTVIEYADLGVGPDESPEAGTGSTITVVAVDFPDNERTVFSYTIPEEADTS